MVGSHHEPTLRQIIFKLLFRVLKIKLYKQKSKQLSRKHTINSCQEEAISNEEMFTYLNVLLSS